MTHEPLCAAAHSGSWVNEEPPTVRLPSMEQQPMQLNIEFAHTQNICVKHSRSHSARLYEDSRIQDSGFESRSPYVCPSRALPGAGHGQSAVQSAALSTAAGLHLRAEGWAKRGAKRMLERALPDMPVLYMYCCLLSWSRTRVHLHMRRTFGMCALTHPCASHCKHHTCSVR